MATFSTTWTKQWYENSEQEMLDVEILLWNQTICNTQNSECKIADFHDLSDPDSNSITKRNRTVAVPWYTEASLRSRTAAASTMLRMTNFLIALSFGTHRAQFVQRTGLTWPRPFFERPLFLRFFVYSNQQISDVTVYKAILLLPHRHTDNKIPRLQQVLTTDQATNIKSVAV